MSSAINEDKVIAQCRIQEDDIGRILDYENIFLDPLEFEKFKEACKNKSFNEGIKSAMWTAAQEYIGYIADDIILKIREVPDYAN